MLKNKYKSTGIYRTNDDIDNLRIRISLKKLYSIIQIPKFEAIQSQSSDQQSTDYEEIIEIKWQEKVFSKTERNYYSQRENCKSDLEKRYHEMLKEAPAASESGMLFTYTNEDIFTPTDNFGERDVRVTQLRRKMEEEREESSDNIGLFLNKFDVNARYINNRKFINMYIMAELDPTTLLFTIQYSKADNLFIVYPDFNDNASSYYLEIDQNSKQMYSFYMENLSAKTSEEIEKLKTKKKLRELQNETTEMLQKMSFSMRDQNFNYPKVGRVVLLLEIVSGVDFEYDNIHVRFQVKLPRYVRVIEGILESSTHSTFKNEEGLWHFGYCHSLVLDIEDEFSLNSSDKITIDFDVISIDPLWDRERREGIASFKMSFSSLESVREVNLQCFRDLQGGSFFIDFLERFFLGGIRNIRMLEYTPDQTINFYGNQTIATGQLKLKVQQIRQMRTSCNDKNLKMQTVDEIISYYHKVKAKLNSN